LHFGLIFHLKNGVKASSVGCKWFVVNITGWYFFIVLNNFLMMLEVCAFNIQSCGVAEMAGAGRIELCADPLEGGTTPSYGLLQYAREHIAIPVFPMVRPRGGNFVYDGAEIAIMKKDIIVCQELGFGGIATGAQLATGKIDADLMKRIVEWAYPMEVTCHKVFDGTPDACEALEALIAAGCARVLTSGTGKTAMDGAAKLAKLVAQAGTRIIVMPGGGVRSTNIAELAKVTGAKEYHSSGIVARGIMNISDGGEVRAMVQALANEPHY
jgi:copper homeostasis protein